MTTNEDNKSYRVRTSINGDPHLNVKIDSDIDIIELLSLKIDTESLYKLQTSDYGCIAGRVLANGNVGVPNAKISVFIPKTEEIENDHVLSSLYPYETVYSKDEQGRRYNTFPSEQQTECHTPIGTFPSKRMVLDDDHMIEIYNSFYKYTTRSNGAGDYMIFGVPTGEQTVHVDIDLSDIGELSQRPSDMLYKGYNMSQFENSSKFKSDVKLDNLSQVISQNTSVNVTPFWGNDSFNEISITRNDIDVQYKFEPTCVFIGSIITDDKSNGVSRRCIPTDRMGKMDKITTGSGTIEMIRKRADGKVESFEVQGTEVIDGNGTWCYQIPMNLDYMMTDEYGNLVPTNDPEKGIPTRTRVRFRVSLTDYESDYGNNHLSKVLVPNNPHSEEDVDYVFGTDTKDDEFGTKSFRDLFWNNVYTVKSYIPRVQKGNKDNNKRFTGIKAVNVNGSNNSIPYNNMRIRFTFMFTLQCAMFKILLWIMKVVNSMMTQFGSIARRKGVRCLYVGDGICPDLENWYFAPKCRTSGKRKGQPWRKLKKEILGTNDDTYSVDSENSDKEVACLTNQIDHLVQCVEIALAMEYEVISFDFYNDWLNGTLYIPRWFSKIRKKKKYRFGRKTRPEKLLACTDGTNYSRRYVQQCALSYDIDENGQYSKVTTSKGCKSDSKQKCGGTYGRIMANVFGKNGGFIHAEKTMLNQNVYYFKPCEWIMQKGSVERVKANLFATDIVLLGSLNNCDRNGIPAAFTELESSSFVMPTNLAATNMNDSSFMYGFKDKHTACSGSGTKAHTEPVTTEEQTFDSYNSWGKGLEDFDSGYTNEYAVTEAAGIDWGYSGPHQGEKDFGSLYFPGGHFLGISCVNSEVNIKSCINLQRACEIGSDISRRRAIPYDNNGSIAYKYIIPNGLIGRDDITDSDFRRAFSTMNQNRLKTRHNPENGYLEYDFKSMNPMNFDGGLDGRLGDGSYTGSFIEGTIEVDGKKVDVDAYKRALEKKNEDYYNFRFGVNSGEDTKSKFLAKTKPVKTRKGTAYGYGYALPVYENSFYFYFGLKDGQTAFDRFIKDYYASCKDVNEYETMYKVSYTNTTLCNGEDGEIKLNFIGAQEPYSISLSRGNTELLLKIKDGVITEDEEGGEKTVYTEESEVSITGLITGEYTVTFDSLNTELISYNVNIGVVYPVEATEIKFNVTDFTETFYVNDVAGFSEINNKIRKTVVEGVEKDFGGYFEVTHGDVTNIQAVILANETCYKAFKFDGNTISDLGSGYTFDGNATYLPLFNSEGLATLWQENENYSVYIDYKCGDNVVKRFQNGEIFCSGPRVPDLYFGNTDVTYNRLIYYGYKEGDFEFQGKDDDDEYKWYFEALSENTNGKTPLTEDEKAILKSALFFTDSFFTLDGGQSVDIGFINNNGIIEEQINGWGETLDDDDDDTVFKYWHEKNSGSPVQIENYMESGYSCDLNDNFTPTKFFYEDKKKMSSYFNDYVKYYKMNGTKYGGIDGNDLGDYIKGDFRYQFKKQDDSSFKKIRLPLIYRPFYANVLFYVEIKDASNLEDGEQEDIFKIADCKVKYAIFNGITKKVGEDDYRLGKLEISIDGKTKKSGLTDDGDYVYELNMSRKSPDTPEYSGTSNNNTINEIRFYTIGDENSTSVIMSVDESGKLDWKVIEGSEYEHNGDNIAFSFKAVDNLSESSNVDITEISEVYTIDLTDLNTGRFYNSNNDIVTKFINDSVLGTTFENHKLNQEDKHEEHVNGKWFGSVCLKNSGITVDKEVTSDYVYRVIDDAALYDGEDKIYDSGKDDINGDTEAYKYFPYQTTFVTYVIKYPKSVYNKLLNQYKDNTSNDAATTTLDETV